MAPLRDQRDWMSVLRVAVEKRGLKAVADQLGRSKSCISSVLGGNCPASTKVIEQRVRGELMNKRIECPVLGEISPAQCQDEQVKPFAATNPTRVQLWKACHGGCPNFRRK